MEDSSPRPYQLRKRRVKFCRRVPYYNISQLPSEVLLQFFKCLSLKDLLAVKQVCTHFNWLIDSNTSLLTTATLVGEWPTLANNQHFEKAADHGNIEALLKLGVAYLYNEGSPKAENSNQEMNGTRAAEYFCRAESLTPRNSLPFTWLFIRPPWSQSGSCCKEQVFNYLKASCIDNQNASKSVLLCIAEIQHLLQEENDNILETPEHWYRLAASSGSSQAAYLLWLQNRQQDQCNTLNDIRQLRELASKGCVQAKLDLLEAYSKGHYGGLDEREVMQSVRSYMQSSKPSNSQMVFNVQEALTSDMRYILIDWLVEVSSTKETSRTTIHTVVHCVDRYLMTTPISRATLQLVGIAAMVLVSRLLEKDIFTIREAAWLTEGAYKYEEVVRMMGDIVATLHGQIRVPIILDYLEIINKLIGSKKRAHYLSLYISELCLLYAEFGSYPLGKLAASCVLLARIMLFSDEPWPEKMADYTGYTIVDLRDCVLHIHQICFNNEPMVDHRKIVLAAVKERYQDAEQEEVSKIDIIAETELRQMLCCVEYDPVDSSSGALIQAVLETPNRDYRDEPFVLSPSRRSRSGSYSRSRKVGTERENRVVTPTIEVEDIDNSFLEIATKNESFVSIASGYEGDGESEGEVDSMECHDNEEEIVNTVVDNDRVCLRSAVCNNEPGPSCGSRPPSNNKSKRYGSFSVHIDSMDTNKASNSPAKVSETESPKHSLKRSSRLRVKGKSFQFDVNGKLQMLRAPLQRVENNATTARPMTRQRMAGKRKSTEDHTEGSDCVYLSL